MKLKGVQDLFFEPVDPAWLSCFRIAFGICMFIHVPFASGLAAVDETWGLEWKCRFPLFDEAILPRPSLEGIILCYTFMWIGSVLITFGLFTRTGCLMFAVPHWWLLLLDKQRWNHHVYLFGLLAVLLSFCQSERKWSLDSFLFTEEKKPSMTIPLWNYYVLRFQIVLVYVLAGIKKLHPDWINGFSVANLEPHWLLKNSIGSFLNDAEINLIIVHWGGLLYDLSVGPMLCFSSTRPLAILLSLVFHGINAQTFQIGLFPYVMMASCILFLNVRQQKNTHSNVTKKQRGVSRRETEDSHRRRVLILFGVYSFFQICIPFSHFLTPGYNGWSDGIYGYSWDMMVHRFSANKMARVKELDTNDTFDMDLGYFIGKNHMWSHHPDAIKQTASCVERLVCEFTGRCLLEVSFPDLWVAVNGRPFQHPIQPNLQVLEAHWSPWRRPSWVTELRGDNWIHYPQRPFPTGDKTRNSVFTQPNLYLADKGDFLRLDFLPGGEAELAKGGSVLRYLFRVLQGTIKIKDPSRVSRPPMSAHSTNVIRTKKGSILEVASETAVVSVVKEISAVEIKSRKSERKQKWHWPFVRSLLMIEGALTNALLGGWEDHVGDLEEGAGFVNLSMSWFK